MSVKSNLSAAVQKEDTSLSNSQYRTSGSVRGKISPKEISVRSHSQERTSPAKTLSPQELSGLKNAHYPYHSFTLPKHCCVNCEFDSRPVTRRNPIDMPEEIKSSTRPLVANTQPENPCEVNSAKDYAHSIDDYAGPVPQLLLNEQIIIGLPDSNKIQKNENEEPTSEEVNEMTKETLAVQIVVQQDPEGHICSETCDCTCKEANTLPKVPSDDHAVQADIKSSSHEKSCITSAAEHEYLQFALRITEDIIKNDLYSNSEIKRVFNSHIEANRGRLNEERMKDQLKKLALELNLSYSDILLCNADYDSDMPSSDQKECDCCACYDLEVIDCLCGSDKHSPELFDEITCTCDGDSTHKPTKNRGGKHARRRRNSRRHSRKSTERRAFLKGEKKSVPKAEDNALLKAEEKVFLHAEEKAFQKAEERALLKAEEKNTEEPMMTMHMRSHALNEQKSSFVMQNGCPKRRYGWCDSNVRNQQLEQERRLKKEQFISAVLYHEKSSAARSKVEVQVHTSVPAESSDCEKSMQSDDWKVHEKKSLKSNCSRQEESVSTVSECTCETDMNYKQKMSHPTTKDESTDIGNKNESTDQKDESIKADKSTKTDICSEECQEPSKKKKSGHRKNSSKSKSRTAKSKQRSSSGPSKIQAKRETSTPNDKPNKRASAKNLTEHARTGTPKGRKTPSKRKTSSRKSDSTKANPTKKETTDTSVQSEKDIVVATTSPILLETGTQSDKGSQDTVELKCRKKCGSRDSVKSAKGRGKTKHHKEKTHKGSVSSGMEEFTQVGKDACCKEETLSSIPQSQEKCSCVGYKDELTNLGQLAVTKLALRNRPNSRETGDRRPCLEHKRPGYSATPNVNVDILVQTEELNNLLLKPLVRHVSPPFTSLVQSNLVGSSYVKEPDQNLANENDIQSGEAEGYLMMPAPIYISPQGIGLVSPTMAYYPPGLKTIQVTPATDGNLTHNDNNKSSKSPSKRSKDTQTKLCSKGCCICPSVPSTKCTLKTCHAIGRKSRDDLLLSDYYDNEIPPSVSQFFPTIATQTTSSDFLMIEKLLSMNARVKKKKSDVPLPPKTDSNDTMSSLATAEKNLSKPKVDIPDEGLMSGRQMEEQRAKMHTLVPHLEEGEEEEEIRVEGPSSEHSKDALRLRRRRTNKRSPHLTSHSEQLLQEVGEKSDSTLEGDTFTRNDEKTVVGTALVDSQPEEESETNISVADSDMSNYQKPVAFDGSNIENEVMVGGSDDDFMKKLDHKPDMSMTTSMEQRIRKVVHDSEIFRHPQEKGAEWANVNLKLLEGDENTLSEEEDDESTQDNIIATQSVQSKFALGEPKKSRKLENTTTIGENDDGSESSKSKI